MTDYLTEQEQVELLKNWIKQYSGVFILGIFIAIVGVTGWNYWQDRQQRILHEASAIYEQMLLARSQNNAEETLKTAQKLFTDYPKTVYGPLAALAIARENIVAKQLLLAEKKLQWVIDHSKVPAFKQIARIRLARVLNSEQKFSESLKILAKSEDASFDLMTLDVTGDTYLAMHETDKARETYHKAIIATPNADILMPLLQMKYDNLITSERLLK